MRNQHINVKELLKIANAPYIIARAAAIDGKDDEDKRGWTEIYCRIYRDLMEAEVTRWEKGRELILYVNEYREDYIPGWRAMNVSGFHVDDPHMYAVEFLECEDYNGMLVPNSLLMQYPLEILASEVLREYGWYGAEESTVADEQLLQAALAMLEELPPDRMTDEQLEQRCRQEFAF